MKLSARNVLQGTIRKVEYGTVNTEITLEIAPDVRGGQHHHDQLGRAVRTICRQKSLRCDQGFQHHGSDRLGGVEQKVLPARQPGGGLEPHALFHQTGHDERFPTATEVLVEDIPAWIARTKIPSHAYVVIVTRGHTNDLEALRALAPRDLRYLGLIGSRAKVARIYDALTADAMPADQLRSVHAPIGLDIGAVTPQEIAVSILAELIAVKHGKMKSRDASELSMRWNNLKKAEVAD